MMRKYKLERLQKNILLGLSGVTLASAILFTGAQDSTNKRVENDLVLAETSISTSDTADTVKVLNKAQREINRYYSESTIN